MSIPDGQILLEHTQREPDRIYVGEEVKEIEEELKSKVQLPPLPDGILEWSDLDKEKLILPKDLDLIITLRCKLMLIWQIWGSIRNNEEIIKLVNDIPENSDQLKEYQKSNEFKLKSYLVEVIDKIGKTLNGGTDLTSELTSVLEKK